nr:hypothetical protein [Desulfobulbaceae bacterium]
IAHGSAAMGGMHRAELGAWSAKCVDCHSVHTQEQLYWRTENEAELYLATGTIDGNFSVNGGQTTFSYSVTDILAEWNDRATWGRKNDFLPPSGLILVVDLSEAKNTYEIIRADASSITVKGGLDPSVTGSSFGIIYGQLIKSNIATPLPGNRDVRFFNPKDPAGGYTDSNTPAVSGICQVCHLNTTVWNNDGSKNDDLTHSGNGNTHCTECHIPAEGFKPY